jgi:hypothetical protein
MLSMHFGFPHRESQPLRRMKHKSLSLEKSICLRCQKKSRKNFKFILLRLVRMCDAKISYGFDFCFSWSLWFLYNVCGLFSVNFEKSLYLCLFRLKAWQNWSKACVNLENFQTKSNNKLERFSSTYFLIFVGKAGASFKGDHSIRQGLKVLQGQTL